MTKHVGFSEEITRVDYIARNPAALEALALLDLRGRAALDAVDLANAVMELSDADIEFLDGATVSDDVPTLADLAFDTTCSVSALAQMAREVR